MTTRARISFEAEDKTRGAVESVKAGIAGVQDAAERASRIFSTGLGAAAAGGLLATALAIRNGIDELDRLDETAPKIGVTAQKLAELGYNAKMSGASTEALEKGIATLSQKMAAGDKVFEAMGIKVRQANGALRETDDVLGEMADKFATYADGPGKVALAQEAMGKSGRELIPMLNQGAEGMQKMAQEAKALGLAFGPDALKQAAEYKDNMDRLTTAVQGAGIAMAERMLPGLIQVTDQMVAGAKQGGVLLGVWRGLAEFAQIAFGQDDLGKAISRTAQLNNEIARLGGEVDKQLAILDRDPDNAMAQRRLGSLRKQLEAVQKDALAASDAVKRAVNPSFDMDPSYAALEGRRLAGGPKGQAPRVPGSGGSEKSEYEKLNEELTKRATLLDAAREAGDQLSEARKFELETLAKLDAAYGKLTLAQAVELEGKAHAIKVMMDEAQVRKSEHDQAKTIAEQRQKWRNDDDKASAEALRAIDAERTARSAYARDMLRDLEFEIQLLGMTTAERAKAIAMRDLERAGIKEGTEAWDEYAAAIQRAVGDRERHQAHIDQFQNFWQGMDSAARDTFTNVEEGWDGAVKRMKKTAQTVFLNWLYEQAARPILFNLGARVFGASPGAVNAVGSASGLQNATGLLSSFSNLGGGMDMLGTAFTAVPGLASAAYAAAVPGLTSFAAGSQAALLASQTAGFGAAGLTATASAGATAAGVGGAATGIMSTIGAAIPYVGAFLAVASMFGGSKGGPKVEGGADLASAIKTQYSAFAKELGVTSGANFEAFYSKDPQGDSLTQLRVAAFDGSGRHLYERLGEENVGRSDEEFNAAVGDATMRAIIAALKASDLSDQYKQYLNDLAADASTADMERAIALIGQRKALDEEWLTLTSTEAENLARARKRELDAMDETLRATKERIWAEQDRLKLEEEARDTLRATADRARDELLAGYDREQSAIQAVIDRTNGYIESLRRFGEGLKRGPLALLSPEAQYLASRAEFQRLAAMDPGSEERLAGLEAAGTAFLEASQQYNASSMAYFADLAAVQVATEQSTLHAKATVDVQRSILDANRGIMEKLGLLNTTTDQGLKALLSAYLAAQGKVAATGAGAPDAVITALYQTMLGRAPDTEGLAYWSNRLAGGESLDSLRAAMQASAEYVNSRASGSAAPAASQSPASVVEGLYGSMLGRASDAEGLAYWSDRLASGESLDSVRAAMQASAEYVNRVNGIPGYAGGGMPNGWAWVGEEGPELVNFTQPARVYTAEQSRGMWAAGGDTLALERRLDETNRKLDALIAVNAAAGRRLDPLGEIADNTASLRRAELRESVRAVPS